MTTIGRKTFAGFALPPMATIAALCFPGAASVALAAPDNREPALAAAPQLAGMHVAGYWSTEARAGVFRNHDGIVIQAGDNDPRYVARPAVLPVDVDASALKTAYPALQGFVWTIDASPVGSGVSTRFVVSPGVHELGLSVIQPGVAGQPDVIYRDSKAIAVRDRLIVSLGDSVAAGEGNPDLSGVNGGPVQWQNTRCHRSHAAYGEVAAERVQADDPRRPVTFLSFACSGAGTGDTQAIAIDCSTWLPVPQLGSGECRQRPKRGDEGGILSPYEGEDVPDPKPTPLDSQVNQLRAAIGGRMIDDLFLTVGANDANFAAISGDCASLATECNQASVITGALQTSLDLLGRPGGSYDQVAAYLANFLSIRRVWITTYFDPTTDANGATCPDNKILDDAGIYRPSVTLGNIGNPVQVVGGKVSSAEASWVSRTLIAGLNSRIEAVAARQGWAVVGSTATGGTFAARFSGHGYCAPDHWVVKALESARAQGPSVIPNGTIKTSGVLHPNTLGIKSISDAVVERLETPAPTLTLSNFAGLAANCDRGNGWLSGSQAIGRSGCDAKVGFTVEARNPARPGAAPDSVGILTTGLRSQFAGPLLLVDAAAVQIDRSDPSNWRCISSVVDCVVQFGGAGAGGNPTDANFYITLKAEGRHTFDLRAPNALGVDAEEVWVAKADWTPPSVATWQVAGTTSARILAQDAVSGVEKIVFLLNSTGPWVYHGGNLQMHNGDVIEYWATDYAGNISGHRRAKMQGGRLGDL